MGRTAPISPLVKPLTDGTIRLRHRREPDIAVIAAASADPETLRWLEDPPMDEQAQRTSLARVEQLWASGTSAPLVIADASTDVPVGLTNLQFIDDVSASVAYSVFPAYRGRGIAPRAVALLVGWAVEDLRVERLILEADAGNVASLRVAEKAGFRRVDTRSEPSPGGGATETVVFAWAG